MEPGIERHIGGWFSVGGKVKIPGDRFVIITHREGDDEDTTTPFTSNITQYYKAPALAAQIHDKLPIFSSVKLIQNRRRYVDSSCQQQKWPRIERRRRSEDEYLGGGRGCDN